MKPDNWDAEMEAFGKPNTLLSVQIVHPIDVLRKKVDPALCYVLEKWFTGRRQAKADQSPLCMTCDYEWSLADDPAAFVVILNETDGTACVSALCEACDQHKERDSRCLAVVKQAFGDYEICAKGTGTTQ